MDISESRLSALPDVSGDRAGNRLAYLLPYVAALAMIGVLYWNTFIWWYSEWTLPGSFYAHAMFVPFFVCVMLWRNRERLARVRQQPSWLGLALIVPGMALLLLSERSDITTVQSLSFIFLLIGSTMLLLGTPKTRLLLFPLLFVIMMMPLVPDQLINGIAFPIQIKSAQLATWLLNHLTLSSVQEGTQIRMEHYRMAVELPCSGFKTLLSLLTFSAAFAYLVEAPAWKRWTLFLTTAPLSLFINALRIALIGIVGELIGTSTAQFFHDYSGFIVLILAFTFLFNFSRVLKCERFLGLPLNEEEEKRDAEAAKLAKATGHGASAEPDWWQTVLAWRPTGMQLRRTMPYILALDLVLALTLVGHATVHPPTPKLPIATYQVPKQFTFNNVTYTCVPNPLEETDKLPPIILEVLSPLRVINRDYEGSDGSHIQLFITAGSGRKVFHDPHTCALGSDANIFDLDPYNVQTAHETIKMQEAHWHHTGLPDDKEMMFCYVVQGKVLQRTEQVRNAMVLQTFFGDGGQPSYFVRVFHNDSGTDEVKRQQLANFVRGLWEQIGPILHGEEPGKPDAPPTASHTADEKK